MRVVLRILSGARTAKVPTRRWTPGAGEAPEVTIAAEKKTVDLSTENAWECQFFDFFEYLIPYSY